jgi:hypothetical protein
MKMSVIYQLDENEWSDWTLPLMNYTLGCCDCGLSSNIQFKIFNDSKRLSAKQFRLMFSCKREAQCSPHIYQGLKQWTKIEIKSNQQLKMKCMDCGLIHALKFKIIQVVANDRKGNYTYTLSNKTFRIMMRIKKNNRSTGQLRRNIKCQRCGSKNCNNPDSKECSDNCIVKYQNIIRKLNIELNELKKFIRDYNKFYPHHALQKKFAWLKKE